MADTTMTPGQAGVERPVVYEEPKGFGWVLFAATMMMIAGGLQATYGLVALLNDEWVVWSNQGSLYLDLTEWGWIHLILGTLVALCGLGVFSGNMFARVVGIVAASVSLVVNFLWLPAYPVWALTVIAIDVLVIWAIAVHGGAMRAR
jgi:hypothetical protein